MELRSGNRSTAYRQAGTAICEPTSVQQALATHCRAFFVGDGAAPANFDFVVHRLGARFFAAG
jgi:hypothetical protein